MIIASASMLEKIKEGLYCHTHALQDSIKDDDLLIFFDDMFRNEPIFGYLKSWEYILSDIEEFFGISLSQNMLDKIDLSNTTVRGFANVLCSSIQGSDCC